jgi:hypothetical protein
MRSIRCRQAVNVEMIVLPINGLIDVVPLLRVRCVTLQCRTAS